MSNSRFFRSVAVVSLILSCGDGYPARADDDTNGAGVRGHCVNIDWGRLDLTSSQNQQIQQLETEWNREFGQMRPAIVDDQRKLWKLLQDHNSDPVEIMSLQQSIARRKEQLHALATANYLKKRQLLNENQQHNLEQMMRQMLNARMRMRSTTSGDLQEAEGPTDHIQNLIHRVRNIWPVQQEH